MKMHEYTYKIYPKELKSKCVPTKKKLLGTYMFNEKWLSYKCIYIVQNDYLFLSKQEIIKIMT